MDLNIVMKIKEVKQIEPVIKMIKDLKEKLERKKKIKYQENKINEREVDILESKNKDPQIKINQEEKEAFFNNLKKPTKIAKCKLPTRKQCLESVIININKVNKYYENIMDFEGVGRGYTNKKETISPNRFQNFLKMKRQLENSKK